MEDVKVYGMLQDAGPSIERLIRRVRFRSTSEFFEAPIYDEVAASDNENEKWLDGMRRTGYTTRPRAHPSLSSRITLRSVSRMIPYTFLFLLLVVLLHRSPLINKTGKPIIGVEGGVVRIPRNQAGSEDTALISRSNSATDVCTRWSHQSAIVNGTLYVYGGRATQDTGQTANQWNNDFFSIPLTETWKVSSPTLKGLSQPSGPPPVANGYLWNSYTSLFLYGGEYSDNPATSPLPYSLWEYSISSSSWLQRSSPTTSSGTNSEGGSQLVQQSAEGAGVSIPELGRGFYFGGHLDGYTTSGWSQSTDRVYLKSLLEFTFPGHSNKDIQALGDGKLAGNDGVWRNVTQGGLQDTHGFPERADGALVYVPGYGVNGIILGLAGGTASSFTEMNIIDVYDVANSTWYKQATNGTSPPIRVNPCTVAASAADGSSTNVYMYGGQNLVPYKEQIQYDDMWILTIPSFTWIKVDTTGQSVPYPRAGHTCHIWDSQMIVVGGYVGKSISCDSPGVYVFDASQLKWQNQFTALDGGNAENQQASQTQNLTGLSGSYGYQVPSAVQQIIGGQASGGATVTAPAILATAGPLATGKPLIYNLTQADGSATNQTATHGTAGLQGDEKASGPNIAAIVAGVIAGLFFLLACYLGFCTWVYRRQLQLYKNHVAMAQRAAMAGATHEKTAFFGRASGGSSDGRGGHLSTDASSGPSGIRSSAMTSGGSSMAVPPLPAPIGGISTTNSSTDDLVANMEPSFVGVLLNPRRSLRVINRD